LRYNGAAVRPGETDHLLIAIRFAWLFIATVLAIAVHEGGHLVCGLVAGK
jgi:hypothetical protein